MKKGNIIDLIDYRHLVKKEPPTKPSMSKELEKAIQDLITRLREPQPA